MPQLALTGRQSAANLAQRLGPAQLAEQHGDELSPTAEAARSRSARCFRAAVSNPVREMSCKICEKMLHTRFKAESSSDSLVFSNSTYQRLSAFFFPKAISTAELIWTRMKEVEDEYNRVKPRFTNQKGVVRNQWNKNSICRMAAAIGL